MASVVWTLWLWLGMSSLRIYARLPICSDMSQPVLATRAVLDTILAMERCDHSSLLLVTDGTLWSVSVLKYLKELEAPYGVGIYDTTRGVNDNSTLLEVSRVLTQAGRLRKLLWCVTVVVVSDDLAFLAAFAESSFKNHLLLIETTRLIIFTPIPLYRLQNLHHLHKTVSRTNSLIVVVNNASTVYRFPHGPHLVVTAEQLAGNVAVIVDDPTSPGGQRLTFRGYMDNTIRFIARQMNFTFTYKRPTDNNWGTRQSDGSWTGMVGLLMREEAEIGLGPFFMTQIRFKYLQFSQYITHFEHKVTATLGRPEVDPWGFLLPLSPLVWAAVVTALLAVITVMLMLPSFLPINIPHSARQDANILNCVRVLLQEDVIKPSGWWWWERVVLGVWMLMVLVLTQSYAGNLMSLLAVRHISQAYQSLRNVLDDPSVVLILTADNSNLPYYRTVKSGIFREVGDLLDTERVTYKRLNELPGALDSLVRSGTHVIFDVDTTIRIMMADDFANTGTCEFYMGRSSYLAYTVGILAQKNSPLIPGINKGITWLVESGLFDKWLRFAKPLSKSCVSPPKAITVNEALSLSNLWGMFVVLGIGCGTGVVLLVLETAVDTYKAAH